MIAKKLRLIFVCSLGMGPIMASELELILPGNPDEVYKVEDLDDLPDDQRIPDIQFKRVFRRVYSYLYNLQINARDFLQSNQLQRPGAKVMAGSLDKQLQDIIHENIRGNLQNALTKWAEIIGFGEVALSPEQIDEIKTGPLATINNILREIYAIYEKIVNADILDMRAEVEAREVTSAEITSLTPKQINFLSIKQLADITEEQYTALSNEQKMALKQVIGFLFYRELVTLYTLAQSSSIQNICLKNMTKEQQKEVEKLMKPKRDVALAAASKAGEGVLAGDQGVSGEGQAAGEEPIYYNFDVRVEEQAKAKEANLVRDTRKVIDKINSLRNLVQAKILEIKDLRKKINDKASNYDSKFIIEINLQIMPKVLQLSEEFNDLIKNTNEILTKLADISSKVSEQERQLVLTNKLGDVEDIIKEEDMLNELNKELESKFRLVSNLLQQAEESYQKLSDLYKKLQSDEKNVRKNSALEVTRVLDLSRVIKIKKDKQIMMGTEKQVKITRALELVRAVKLINQ